MLSLYTLLTVRPRELLDRLVAEEAHVRRLAVSSQMWSTAATMIQQAEQSLSDRTKALLANAWHDDAGREFGNAVSGSLRTMRNWHGLITSFGWPNGSISNKIDEVVRQYPGRVAQVRQICDDYDKQVARNKDDSSFVALYIQQAGQILDKHDEACRAVTSGMKNLAHFATEWEGPRAAIPDGGAPGTPRSPGPAAAGAGTPAAAAAPEPAAVDPGAPATVPTNSPTASDPLSAAASALEAAQGLLDGMQVPDAIPVPDLGGLGLDPAAYPEPQYGLPALSGFDAGASGGGASAGGIGAGTTAMTGPGAGGAVGAGNAPVAAAGLARGLASAAGGSMPPMSPPMSGAGAGAGAAGARNAAGIKPGNSDRPAAESRPRPRRATQATPGVALTGRAGAGAPKPAAQRSWDNENDSLQVLDEHLWQVNQPEEETHGQDRRQPGGDGRDRAAAHRSPDARLAGPGGSAHQPTRAR